MRDSNEKEEHMFFTDQLELVLELGYDDVIVFHNLPQASFEGLIHSTGLESRKL